LGRDLSPAEATHLAGPDTVSRQTWAALVGSNLGWVFDGFETYAVVLTVAAVMHTLLAPAQLPRIAFYQGLALSAVLLGWAIGGVGWGIATDYIGRKRAMMFSIAVYALATLTTFFVQNWWEFILFRLLAGFGLGAEWGTGVTLVSEKLPTRLRALGGGLLQSGFGIGALLAAVIWFAVGGLGPQSWRYMYVIGSLPALALLIYIHRQVSESEAWEGTRDQRRTFTLGELFADRLLRHRLLAAFGIGIAFNVGWWTVSTLIPQYVGTLAHLQHADPLAWASGAGITYYVGGLVGFFAFAFAAEWWGRRVATACFFGLSFAVSVVLFLLHAPLFWIMVVVALTGFFTAGQTSVFAIYMPELFPTRLRATAASFVFNASRFLAFFGPLVVGSLIAGLHGVPQVATAASAIFLLAVICVWFLPETRGRPLPH
jgi:MFS family permease